MKTDSRMVIITIVALLLALYGGMVYLTIGTDYRLTVSNAERLALTLNNSLEQHTSRTLGEAEGALDAVIHLIRDHHRSSAGNVPILQDEVLSIRKKSPQIKNLFVVSRDGIIHPLFGREGAGAPISVKDREYFRYYDTYRDPDPYISAPMISRIDGKWIFVMTRPIYRPDRTLEMIVGLSLDFGYFRDFYRNLNLGEGNGRVVLARNDGTLLMTYPQSDGGSAGNPKASPLFTRYLAESPPGVVDVDPGVIDAHRHLVCCRKLMRYPLVAVVSISKDEVLKPWRVRALKHGSGATLSILLIFILTWILVMRLKNLAHVNEALVSQQQELELAAQVFEQSKQSIVITDPEGMILRTNGYFTELTGYTQEEAIGNTPRILKSQRHDAAFYTELWRGLREEGQWKGEIWNRKKNDEGFAALLSISSVRDKSEKTIYYIGMIDDITEQKLSSERIHHLAHYDILTNLPNRQLFKERFDLAVQQAERYRKRLALLFLDLDNFKKVNDTMGHHAGDLLLQAIAQRILGCVRKIDLVARLGGDEFAIILEDVKKPSDVERITGKIIEAVAEPVDLEGTTVYVGVSIGVSMYPDDGDTFVALSKNADTAMYRAKGAGKNRCQFFDADMAVQVSRRLALETELRRAIPGELFLLYQPQSVVSGNRIIGVEALVRWQHPAKGLINPAEFIHIAEETGQICRLGEWVLETACRQAARWYHEMGTSLRVAVNVSALQLSQPSFFETVESVIRDNRIPPSLLELELTESTVMSHVEENIRSFQRLKQLGVGIAIDDFGTGHSSLSYLKKLPIDRLKIDRSFIFDTPHDKEDVAITRTIIAMARSLGLQVIAEGVEQQCQLDFLREEGCDEYQGYLLARPSTPGELENLLKMAADP